MKPFNRTSCPWAPHLLTGVVLLLPLAAALSGELALGVLVRAGASDGELLVHTERLFERIGPVLCLCLAVAVAVEAHAWAERRSRRRAS